MFLPDLAFRYVFRFLCRLQVVRRAIHVVRDFFFFQAVTFGIWPLWYGGPEGLNTTALQKYKNILENTTLHKTQQQYINTTL